MTLNIDYLILNIELSNTKLDFDSLKWIDYTTRLEEYSTKIYRNVLKVYQDGRQCATVLFLPHVGSCLSENFAQIQFDNWVLYERLPIIEQMKNDILYMLQAKATGINRIDLAVDGLQSDFCHAMFYLMELVRDNAVLIAGRERTFTDHGDTNGNYTGFSMGERGADRYCRFYDKSINLQQKNKPWIKFRHGVFFPNEEENIWRLEMQLNRKFVSHIENIDVIFSWKFLHTLFECSLVNYLELFENFGQVVKARNPKIEIFDRSKLKEYFRIMGKQDDQKRGFYRTKRNSGTEIELQKSKRLFKQMFIRYAKNQENIAPLMIWTEIFQGKEIDWNEYFFKKRDYWIIEQSKKGFEILIDWKHFWKTIQTIEDTLCK
jgi:hypothetical protein